MRMPISLTLLHDFRSIRTICIILLSCYVLDSNCQPIQSVSKNPSTERLLKYECYLLSSSSHYTLFLFIPYLFYFYPQLHLLLLLLCKQVHTQVFIFQSVARLCQDQKLVLVNLLLEMGILYHIEDMKNQCEYSCKTIFCIHYRSEPQTNHIYVLIKQYNLSSCTNQSQTSTPINFLLVNFNRPTCKTVSLPTLQPLDRILCIQPLDL